MSLKVKTDELNFEFSFFESEDSLAKYSGKKKQKKCIQMHIMTY